MFMISFGSYHTLPYPLRSTVYSTCRDPILKWRVIGISNLLMFDTIDFFVMMSIVLSLSRSNQLGGGY